MIQLHYFMNFSVTMETTVNDLLTFFPSFPAHMAAFPRVPPESVAFCAESLGIPCHEDGIRCLSEDVSYRIRQVLNVSVKFLICSQ